MTDKTIDFPMDKKSQSKTIRILSNFLFTIVMLIMVFLIFITAQSRLTGQEPSLFGHRLYIVDSGSMAPKLPVDSMIIVRESPAVEIEKNDIVTYYGLGGETRVTHRIAEVLEGGNQFITRGDANNTEDPSMLDGDRIIGKVVFNIPLIGKAFRFLSSRVGLALLITLGLMWIIVPKVFGKKQ